MKELYESMNRKVRENLERGGALSEEAFERALHETREWAGKLRENYREHYAEDVAKATESIRRDWKAGVRYADQTLRQRLEPERLQAGALGLVARLARGAGTRLQALATSIRERLTYQAGEVAGTGSLKCQQCGEALSVEKDTRIPPCPKCGGTGFSRGY